jgi:hypothetical protein
VLNRNYSQRMIPARSATLRLPHHLPVLPRPMTVAIASRWGLLSSILRASTKQ